MIFTGLSIHNSSFFFCKIRKREESVVGFPMLFPAMSFLCRIFIVKYEL